MDDMALLREYAARNSETAFETLVARRVNFVYSAALRQVRDPRMAEEITQAVFIILAQKAGRITSQTNLAGWLFKTTRFVAIAEIRDAVKRREREREAHMQSEIQPTAPDPLWERMSPLLDEALSQLAEKDRQALLLRFFDNKSLAEVGTLPRHRRGHRAQTRCPRPRKTAPLFFQTRRSLDGRHSRRRAFRQFRPRRAVGAGRLHFRRRRHQRRGRRSLNDNPHQRSLETYGLGTRKNRNRRRRQRSVCRRDNHRAGGAGFRPDGIPGRRF